MAFYFPIWQPILMAVLFIVLFTFLAGLFVYTYERENVDWIYWKQQIKSYLIIYIFYLIGTTTLVLALGPRWHRLKEENYEVVTAISVYIGTFMVEFVVLRLAWREKRPRALSYSTEYDRSGYVELEVERYKTYLK